VCGCGEAEGEAEGRRCVGLVCTIDAYAGIYMYITINCIYY